MNGLVAFLVVTAILGAPLILGWLLYRRYKAHTPATLTEHEAQHKLYGGPRVRVEYKALAHRNGHEGD